MPPKHLSTTPSGNSQSRAVPSRDLILVADDDATVRSYIKTVLESGGFAILEASDGAEALELFRKSCDAIALVITDLRMPRMTGAELATSVRSEVSNIPVIFVSSEPPNPRVHDPANGLFFLEKPFHARDLLFAVQRLTLAERVSR